MLLLRSRPRPPSTSTQGISPNILVVPKAMRFVGKWMAKARGMARHFRSGLDTMMREAELEELEKQWREQNDAIMREFPRIDDVGTSNAASSAAGSNSEAPTDAAVDEAAAATPPETHAIPPKDGPLP